MSPAFDHGKPLAATAVETASLPPADPELPPPSYGPLHPVAVWRRLRRDTPAMFGLILVALFFVTAVFAPWIAPHEPYTDRELGGMNEAPGWLSQPFETEAERAARKSLFGLDVAGRDIFSRVVWGTRTSLLVGAVVVGLASLIGVTLGCISGYAGGRVDSFVMRSVDVLLSFPTLILALAMVSIFERPTLFHIALILGLASWPGICRLMRGQVLATRENDYVKAALALGAGHTAILTRHVLPNCIAPVVIWAMMGIAGAVMGEASLGFLGLGDPESTSWGTMINTGLKSNFPDQWWPVAFPAIALALLVLAFNLVGDGLQDAINPKLKR